MNREEILSTMKQALAACQADQAEVVLISTDEQLTRFANSIIHQNTSQEEATLTVRLIKDKRIGIASSNRLDPEEVLKTVQAAANIAALSPQNPEFVSLPGPHPIHDTPAGAFVEATARCTPEQRADSVAQLVGKLKGHPLKASGAFSTSLLKIGVLNSLGVEAYTELTHASLSTVLLSPTSAGYADSLSSDVTAIDVNEVAEEAIERALRGQDPQTTDIKEMEAVFLPYAVSTMLDYLAYMSFGAMAMQEKRSFMADKMGQKVAADSISIWDDGRDPAGWPLPFDFEGQPKHKVHLIQEGIARGVVYDSFTAHREGKESTGHALPQPNGFGALPLNLVMAPGDASLEEMIAGTEDGVLVTRLWYVRPVHPKETLITGMTRDGTFKIDHGKITKPLRNLRFTSSILAALEGTQGIGREQKLQGSFFGGSLAPALKVRAFTFNGQTTY
jgi:PmbA protein